MRQARRGKRGGRGIPVQFIAGSLRGRAHIDNLSEDGLFVRGNLSPETGEEVHVSFTTPDGRKVEVSGLVWWTTAQRGKPSKGRAGFGVRLISPNEDYLRFCQQLVRH